MNSKPFSIFLLAMAMFFILKPKQFYVNDKLKSWQDINFDKPETLYNIYVYAVIVAIIAHYV